MRVRPLSFLLASLAAACVPTVAETENHLTAGDDTDGQDDVDDTNDPDPNFHPEVAFSFAGHTGGTWLTLTHFRGDEGKDFQLGNTLRAEPVGEEPTLALELGAPPEEDLAPFDGSNPDFRGAMYLPALHVDADDDGIREEDDSYVGIGMVWPVYVTGTIPPEVLQMGVVEGWNAIAIHEEDDIEILNPMAIPLDDNLRGEDAIAIGGSATETSSNPPRIALVPYVAFQGHDVGQWLYDGTLHNPWEIKVSGAVPKDHVGDVEGLGENAALEIPLAYADHNGDGHYSDGDEPLSGACYGDRPVFLVYVTGATDLQMALGLAFQGAHTGWSALVVAHEKDAPPVVLSYEERDALWVGPGCSLGD